MIAMGPRESPLPRSAPARVWLTQLNSRKNVLARMNSTPYSITAGSGVNSFTAGVANITISSPTAPVTAMDRPMVISVPRWARCSCFAPMFWLTKVVAAMAVDCMGSMMN